MPKIVELDSSSPPQTEDTAPSSSQLDVSPGHGWRVLSGTLRTFLLLVMLPTALATTYYVGYASDIYVSESKYAIRAGDELPQIGLLTGLFGGGGSTSGGEDALIVRDYILSKDMLTELQARFDLRRHFSQSSIDWIARLPDEATEEKFLDYYRSMVDAAVDTTSGITTLNVKAFDPEMNQEIAKTILSLSEDLVNKMSKRITEDTLGFALGEVSDAEMRIRQASQDVTQFRKDSKLIDPTQETSSVLGIITQLETQLAASQTELAETRTFMQRDSSKMRTIESRIAALVAQVGTERARLANEGGDDDLTRLIYGYEPLVLEQTLAEQRYTSALTALEAAQAEAQRKQKYLLAFVQPNFPDEALEPQRIRMILLVFVGATLAFAIGGLLISALKEHAGI